MFFHQHLNKKMFVFYYLVTANMYHDGHEYQTINVVYHYTPTDFVSLLGNFDSKLMQFYGAPIALGMVYIKSFWTTEFNGP